MSQYVLVFSVSSCVNKNAWNIKSPQESETFLLLLHNRVIRAIGPI